MRGEMLLWMRLADRNNWSLAEARARVSSREFVLWVEYMEWDVNAFHREDYYHAQTAQEVRRVLCKTPRKIKHEHFLLTFEAKGEKNPTATNRDVETQLAKAYWAGLCADATNKQKRET